MLRVKELTKSNAWTKITGIEHLSDRFRSAICPFDYISQFSQFNLIFRGHLWVCVPPLPPPKSRPGNEGDLGLWIPDSTILNARVLGLTWSNMAAVLSFGGSCAFGDKNASGQDSSLDANAALTELEKGTN